ncbi:apical membrane antigen 1 [Plasmodium gaboni]|uniref:Apical membrane antigen 1 n=1 Tax=Plasmodium gaboni TaxID=647221 RepID=A0A151LJ17_9APIC|nr:apical membrane antigen 1 [Plasmodium gaboni]KYN98970.1 apical membrane antigen 1 [Plasmodium gaboni]
MKKLYCVLLLSAFEFTYMLNFGRGEENRDESLRQLVDVFRSINNHNENSLDEQNPLGNQESSNHQDLLNHQNTHHVPHEQNLYSSNEEVERSNHMSNPWTEYMAKYNIEEVHGSGIRVDLGEDVEVAGTQYRVPSGKCPVFGKGIIIENTNTSFLKPVATGNQNLKDGGFAFPSTNPPISPMLIENIRHSYRYNEEMKNLDDVTLCSRHAGTIVPDNDQNSNYKYPAVYDEKNKTCYILYIAAQENNGPRYCNKDENNRNSMFCFRPAKDNSFQNYIYLSKNVVENWKSVCPHKNVYDAKFGLWVDGNCEEIPHVNEFPANDLSECNKLVFELSASDQPKQYEPNLTDYQKIQEGFVNNNLNMIKSAFLPTGAFNADRYKSHGKGYNWGNYNRITQRCEIFNVKPTCLINTSSYIATTALSHPTEIERSFPCSIYKDEIKKEIERESRLINLNDNNEGNGKIIAPRIFISNDIDSLKCPCAPEMVSHSTCNFYVCRCVERRAEVTSNNEVVVKEEYKNEYDYMHENKPTYGKMKITIAASVAIFILAAILMVYLYKRKGNTEKYDKMDQPQHYGKTKSRNDEMLDPEASFWGEEKRASHTTPVLMEKPYY